MELRESILRTVAYYDIFDYPLTRAETQRWLYGLDLRFTIHDSRIAAVEDEISNLIEKRILKEEKGMISLSDREGLADLRASRYRYSCRKWKRARRWARIFSAFPGVELVGIGNTLAYHNAKDGSDIDFFIITKPGTIWRTRCFCAALAALFNLRPTPKDSRDKLCLSFFITSDHLDLQALLPTPHSLLPGIYLYYWIRQMVPIAGTEEAAKKFINANAGVEDRGSVERSRFWVKIFSPLDRLPGGLFKNWQIKYLPLALRQAASRDDGSVVISDGMLKFHINDRRGEVYNKWKNRVDSILS